MGILEQTFRFGDTTSDVIVSFEIMTLMQSVSVEIGGFRNLRPYK